MNKTLILGLASLSILFIGCPENDDGSSASTAAATTMSGGGAGSCDLFNPDASEIECGTRTEGDTCQPDDETGTDGGGGGTEGVCEDDNQMVVDCIAQAEADGTPFRFSSSSSLNGGQSDTHATYHVAVDGSMWRTYSGLDDLCTFSNTKTYAAVDFGGCGDWDCIESRISDASGETCESEQNCEDGI